jgi:hypothetical protein
VTIWCVYGPIGSGKNQALIRFAERAMSKRRVYANFALDGARPLLDVRDCVAPAFAGSLLIWDEVGSQFNARATMDADEMLLATLSQSRKNRVDVIYATQHPRFVDVQLRSLTFAYIEVERVGPTGETIADPEFSPRWWQRPFLFTMRPWWFNLAYFLPDDFSDDWELKPGAEAFKTEWFLFSVARSSRYNTLERVRPRHLWDRWDAQCASAGPRAELPAFRVERGHVQVQSLGPEYELAIPAHVSRKRAPAAAADVAAVDVLREWGYEVGEDASAPAVESSGALKLLPSADGVGQGAGDDPADESGQADVLAV